MNKNNELQLIKIRSYSIGRSGLTTKTIPLPKVWLEDNNLKVTDKIEMFRAYLSGRDVLIIAKKDLS